MVPLVIAMFIAGGGLGGCSGDCRDDPADAPPVATADSVGPESNLGDRAGLCGYR